MKQALIPGGGSHAQAPNRKTTPRNSFLLGGNQANNQQHEPAASHLRVHHQHQNTKRSHQMVSLPFGRPTLNKVGAIVATPILTMKFITDSGEVGILKGDISEAERCHGTTLHNSKEQFPRPMKPDIAAKIHLADLEPPGRKISERSQ
ncbi:hypothetical protein PIB30_068376 [Stylosanthes scabra]|uniref:Uncharacterized protein n=1 Tax=Stylosanthes scabra TaxID=79078 RepID=A0ABU6QNI9_9FABA|nr:hypothetical protein [Stylosanthes scabra]